MTDDRFQKAEFAAWIGIAGNLALALFKAIVGIKAQSKALLADALHSASAVAVSLIALAGLRAARRQPEQARSYGQSKAEALATVIFSALLLVVGGEMAISACRTLWHGVETAPKGYAAIAIGIAVAVKEAIFQYKRRLGNKQGAPALPVHAGERRSELYSALAALVGMLGALAGAYWSFSIFYYFDPLAALFISLLILRTGFRLVKEALRNTLDRMLRQEDAAELIKAVQRMKGIIAVDNLQAREQGHYVIVDLTISVNPRISVGEGQDIAKAVRLQLMKRFSHVSDVVVHVNPYDPGYPYKNNMDMEQSDYPTLVH